MTSSTHWTRAALAATTILTSACALDVRDDDAATTADDDGSPELSLAAPNPVLCTAVKMTAPKNGFFTAVNAPITLTAVATCPVLTIPQGQRNLPTAEYQFWVKPVGASNWQILGGFVPGSSSWTPPSSGDWAVSVVTRRVGAPQKYQARSMAVIGSVTEEADRAPLAGDDAITTNVNASGSTDLLANDTDPDDDVLSVTSFTQGAHGSVTVTAGVASYMPVASYFGPDSFAYTVDDGHGMTDTATVTVAVSSEPACVVSITGSLSGVFGQPVHLEAVAECATGPAQLQWYHKINSAYAVVQEFGKRKTLDFSADLVGPEQFYAVVRTLGTTRVQGMSNIVSIPVVDNTPQCSQVKIVAPPNGQAVTANTPVTLTASAMCPLDSTPEYQFWVKPADMANWQILPAYTTASGSWTPPAAGAWSVKAVVRTTGSHVGYQVASMAVPVNVFDPVCLTRLNGSQALCL